MARKRMIDPHIWEDPSFNKLSFAARLLFIGMISNADDRGYLRGDKGSLKRLVFGFDEIKNEDMDKYIQELKTMKTLHFFEKEDEEYVHLVKWDEYQAQRPDRIQPSVYPVCDKCQTSDGHLPAEVKLSKVKLSKDIINIDAVGKNDASIEDLNISLEDEVKNIDKEDKIRYDYQFQGLQLWENLKAPVEKKSSFIKTARDENPSLVSQAYQFARDYPISAIRWKMFFKQLHHLKQQGADK